jgi:D-alanyl-D-alanine carboxypeptidase
VTQSAVVTGAGIAIPLRHPARLETAFAEPERPATVENINGGKAGYHKETWKALVTSADRA